MPVEDGKVVGRHVVNSSHSMEGELRDKLLPSRSVRDKREFFSLTDMEQLEKSLQKVQGLSDIVWQYTERGLEIDGLMDEASDDPVIIGHPRSALAFLDAYVLGYNHGREDALDVPPTRR